MVDIHNYKAPKNQKRVMFEEIKNSKKPKNQKYSTRKDRCQ